MKLLNTNSKMAKGSDKYIVTGLSLAPHTLAGGPSLCPESTPGCRSACNLWFGGHAACGDVNPVRTNMIAKTLLLQYQPEVFFAQLDNDLDEHVRRAGRLDKIPLCRLNVSSDRWWTTVIRRWPMIQFYDYTKVVNRMHYSVYGPGFDNYALTYSRNENSNQSQMAGWLRRGFNVSQVFDVEYNPAHDRLGPLPESVKIQGEYWPVVDGDKHDLRIPECDGRGVIVGLRLKGTKKARAAARATKFAL